MLINSRIDLGGTLLNCTKSHVSNIFVVFGEREKKKTKTKKKKTKLGF